MATSNNSKTEKKKKIQIAETSKTASKTKKKKLKFSNGNKASIALCSSTEFQQQDNAVVTNGTKSTKPKRKLEEDEEDAKTQAFPMNRIRTMIKGEDPDSRVSQEAILAINKATEKFLQQFTQDAYACCVQERKKSLSYNHLAYVVSKQRRYDFLSDFVPEKVKAEDALRERNSGGNGGG